MSELLQIRKHNGCVKTVFQRILSGLEHRVEGVEDGEPQGGQEEMSMFL